MGRNRSEYDYLTELVNAINYNQEEHVKYLLETIPVNLTDPVNAIDPTWGRTPLFLAVDNENVRIVKMLLEKGADPNIEENTLHVAVSRGSLEIVELLVSYGIDVNRVLKSSGKTALHVAVKTNQTEMAIFLLGCKDENSPSKINEKMLLHMALRNCNRRLSLILAKLIPSSDVDLLDNGFTALHLAVERRYIEVIKELIKKKDNVNRISSEIVDQLHIAIKNKDRNMIQQLVGIGTEKNVSDDVSALHYAINQGYEDIVTLLLDNGVATIKNYNMHGLTALHVAVLSQNLDMAKLCISYGADVDAYCKPNKQTSLYYAIAQGHYKIAKLLLENGAKFDTWVCDCSTLMDHALFSGSEPITRLFIERGAAVNLFRFEDGEEAHLAIKILAEVIFKDSNMLKMVKSNWDDIQECTKHREYYNHCVQELTKMRDVKIFNNVTLQDLMVKNLNQLATLSRNEEFITGFLRIEYTQSFPIYSEILLSKFNQARVRGELLVKAKDEFARLKKFALPAICAQTVLENLDEGELKNFLRGICHCKGEHTCDG
ncbi:hypothetical protein TSAR_000576 [Trichomalopsis sarcophagae]|uniref:Uncharacterized protein n=1 Tax=Trichomalopsis sarcophagae TaxID=543379 RepID=A0A232F3Y6_9HYME|nr:hypothetical protein TSAR_000576 [Trichomalopsis sarcophagae]